MSVSTVPCKACDGTGKANVFLAVQRDRQACDGCHGAGVIAIAAPPEPRPVCICPRGWASTPDDRCPTHGVGRVRRVVQQIATVARHPRT